jgi:hypothetical protein
MFMGGDSCGGADCPTVTVKRRRKWELLTISKKAILRSLKIEEYGNFSRNKTGMQYVQKYIELYP